MRNLLIIIGLFLFMQGFATNKYWGGTGNSNSASRWFTDSTFSTTTTVPTSSDNVYFTKAAGNVTCTINANLTCLNFDCHGWGGTITGSGNYVLFYGNVYLNGTFTSTAVFDMVTTNNVTFTANGKSIAGLETGAGSSSGKLTLQDNLTITGYIGMNGSTIDFNGKTVSNGNFVIWASTFTSTLTMGNANWTETGYIDFATNGSNFIFNCNTSTIHMTGTSATTAFKGNGKTFYNVSFDGATGGAVISGSNIFTNLTLAPSSAKTYQFTDGTTQTVGSLVATGSAGNWITLTGTSTGGWTISDASGTNDLNWCILKYSTASGGATFNAGLYSCNGGNNSGWKFRGSNALIFGTDF